MPTPNGETKRVIRQQIKLQHNTEAEIVRILKKADLQIRMILADSPSDYQIYMLPQIKLQIAKVLNELGAEALAVLAERTAQMWETGIELVDAPLNAGGTRLVVPTLDTRQLIAMQGFLTDKIREIEINTLNKINTQLGLAMVGGQPISSTVSNISKVLEEERWRAKRIVYTELGRVYNIAAEARLEQAGEEIPQLKKMWLKSGKANRRENHVSAHKQVVPFNGSFSIQGKFGVVKMKHPKDPRAPPAETINCGCSMIPYMDEWGMSVK
jgi:hypothetical protein